MIATHASHHSFWYYIFEACYLALQGGSAKIQAVQIARNLPIVHFWWAAGMLIVAGVMIVAYHRLTHCKWKEALKLGLGLLLVRFVSFTPWLNKFRKKPFFYLGNESVQDRLLKGWYPWAWGVALAGLLILQLI